MAALSRTVRLKTKSTAPPCHWRPLPGPTGVLPLVGFRPNRLVNDAGIRIDPPPSLAPAIGTTPAATAAAEPRSEEHTSELQSRGHLVCRLLLATQTTYDPR